MQTICKASAIVAVFMALAACGQRGALYLPTVPPLPEPAAAPQASPLKNTPAASPLKPLAPFSSSSH